MYFCQVGVQSKIWYTYLMENTKICTKCGKNFEKKITCSRRKWSTIRCCSKSCAKKGVSPSNKGVPLSEERKLHLHNVLLGRTCNTGRTHIKKGQRISPNTEFKPGQTSWLKGKKNPHFTGSNNPKWKGGITTLNKRDRWSVEMKNFRNEIFKRDNYACKHCKRVRKVGDRVILNVHHKKSFALYKELRFVKSNVITLCRECHNKIHYNLS